MRQRFPISKEELVELYVNQHLTSLEIAERLGGTTYSTILRRLAEFGIPVTSIKDVRKGLKCSEETKKRMSAATKGNSRWLGKHHSPEAKQKLRTAHLGTVLLDKTRHRMSEKHKELFRNPAHKERILTAMASGTNVYPNHKESVVFAILQALEPNEWEFIGDRKERIGGRNPDFINRRRNLLCEHFGRYWHGQKARNDLEREDGRIAHFRKYGYETLVIWEQELKPRLRPVLVDKMRTFLLTNA